MPLAPKHLARNSDGQWDWIKRIEQAGVVARDHQTGEMLQPVRLSCKAVRMSDYLIFASDRRKIPRPL
jgi:hypothetical protein